MVVKLLVGKPEGKRPLGRPRHRWVNNIRMDLVDVGWGDFDWIGLAQDESSGSIECWETIEWPQLVASEVVLSSRVN
jgi:hypothetical protein